MRELMCRDYQIEEEKELILKKKLNDNNNVCA